MSETPRTGDSPMARFRRKVTVTSDGCLIWTGCLTDGYGQMRIAGKSHRAHRWYYEQVEGPIPTGLFLDHLCRVRACVNPAHLRPVSNRENLLAPGSQSPSAIEAARTECRRGHRLAPGNLTTFRLRSGKRRCRACSAAVARAAVERRRGTALWTEDDLKRFSDQRFEEFVRAGEVLAQ